MSDLGQTGKMLVVVGAVTALVGGLLWLLSRMGWVGRLPGDIRIQRPGFSCLIPIASSILLSIVLTVALNLVIRLLRR
jgi:hypothetical protein